MNLHGQQNSSVDRRTFLQSAGAASLVGITGLFSDARAADKTAASSNGKLIVHTEVPMNAEPPLNDLVASWLTPVEKFYIRSHAPNPDVDVNQFRLSVEGLVRNPLKLTLDELAGLSRPTSIIATMTCAGNRRSEHEQVKPVGGVTWREGAIGNARWSGIRLSEVLKKAGVLENAKHVWFDGLDKVDHKGTTIPFGASIPIEKALLDGDAMPGALLATRMNDQPLAPDHGFPLRTVVPGYIGARSVKWLGRIVVSDRPTPNHYVATAYKLVEEGNDVEWAETAPIYRYPINAAICTPTSGTNLSPGRVTVTGYALPSGDPRAVITRVELSTDGGRSWRAARLTSKSQPYCWRLWSAEIPVTRDTRELIVRATDSRGKTQPEHVDWNYKGYLFNAWHRVDVQVKS